MTGPNDVQVQECLGHVMSGRQLWRRRSDLSSALTSCLDFLPQHSLSLGRSDTVPCSRLSTQTLILSTLIGPCSHCCPLQNEESGWQYGSAGIDHLWGGHFAGPIMFIQQNVGSGFHTRAFNQVCSVGCEFPSGKGASNPIRE